MVATGNAALGCQPGDGAGPEDTFIVTVGFTGIVGAFVNSSTDMVLHARTDCQDGTTEIDCANETTSGTELLNITVNTGDTFILFVDGLTSGDAGSYTLTLGITG